MKSRGKKAKERKRGSEERRSPLSIPPPSLSLPPLTPLLVRFSLRRPNCLHACNRLPTHELILRFEEQLFFWVSLLRIVWYPNHTGSPESPLIRTSVTVITLSAATELNRQSRNCPVVNFLKNVFSPLIEYIVNPKNRFTRPCSWDFSKINITSYIFCCYLYSWIMTCETS